ILVFYCSLHPRFLPSFPTRRSSDLGSHPRRSASNSSNKFQYRFTISGSAKSSNARRRPAAPIRRATIGLSSSFRIASASAALSRSEEHTSELQSRENLVCRLLLEKK